jgi:apolipoprotein N-acyltransferase
MPASAISSSSKPGALSLWLARTRAELPDLPSLAVAAFSALLLILSFPDFDLWPLAWIGLVPLLITIAKRPSPWRAFVLGWFCGTVFFYGSCYWLTYSMMHYGGLPTVIAYLLLVPVTLLVGTFPGAFALVLALAIRNWRGLGLLLAPAIWVSFEWARLGLTGQLWNALGYSQAYHPNLIEAAHWGGVYAVSFLIVAVNASIALVAFNRERRSILIAVAALIVVALIAFLSINRTHDSDQPTLHVVALQPNVPMHLVKTNEEMRELMVRHLTMTETALESLANDPKPRLVIWPESPMNFTYAGDSQFRELVSRFAREHRTSLLFNSQEPGPHRGVYNSAMLINEDGGLVGQYDKIRLLPFGEYVPLPRWLPGAGLITGIVGDFEPGAKYTIFKVGGLDAGVFICIESAYPSIARAFSKAKAHVLINISNDGYLGRTAVMRQHLANAIFRAVENKRHVLRVTNSGISALITPDGEVLGPTAAFEPAVRQWAISGDTETTFYTRYGDLFVMLCSLLSALIFATTFLNRRITGWRTK